MEQVCRHTGSFSILANLTNPCHRHSGYWMEHTHDLKNYRDLGSKPASWMEVSPCETASATTNQKCFSRSLYVGEGTVTRNWALSRKTPGTLFCMWIIYNEWLYITCGLAWCITYYDTALDILWERRDIFKNLGVYPDCMTILRLKYNPTSSYYRVRVQVRLMK